MGHIKKKLVFENGRSFDGFGFGADDERVCEVVFNTSMVGYQEIMSDPSYCAQFVCMTYPLIGNYGLADEDYETRMPKIGGFIVREYNGAPSNYRYTKTLAEEMADDNIPGIAGVDTREIARMIRDEGSMRAIITNADVDTEEALRRIAAVPVPHDQVAQVSCKKKWYSRTVNFKYNVVAIDCGIKYNIIRSLNARGCNVIIVPYNTSAEEIMELHPDGLFISNGPGDPEDVTPVIETVGKLQGKLPIFGICLGHQIISLVNGAHTYKMKFGHRGGNHPVKNIEKGTVEITSQNHSYAVDPASIDGTGLVVTHTNILDKTVEGVKNDAANIFSVQYHPESAPGPQDSAYLFDIFIDKIKEYIAQGGSINA